jgi:hypothetical protein
MDLFWGKGHLDLLLQRFFCTPWKLLLTILAQRALIDDTQAPGGKLNEQPRQLAGPRTFTV